MARVAESFDDLDTKHLKCRMWGHNWEATVSYVVKFERRRAFELHLECQRCEATRTDLTVQGIGLETRAYTRPEGYDIKDVKGWGGRKVFNRNASDNLLSRISKP